MRWRWSYAARATAALTLVLLAAMAGCARSSTTLGSQGDHVTPDPTSNTTPSPEAAGGVKITLARERFGLQESIAATIQNGLATSIWTTDHHSDCGLLTLEYLSGGTWRAVGQCSQPRPVKVVEIAAGASATQSIGFSQSMDMGGGWPAGTYRLSLSYAPSQVQANVSGAITVHSDSFAVG